MTKARVDFDCLVIGAGVVGLAVAREAALAGMSVLLVERHRGFGRETSSRNSEVIHAGIYYPAGSLKARMCVAGRKALYDYATARVIPHSRCGKLIVASNDRQLLDLEDLQRRGTHNGVEDLSLLGKHALRRLEPELSAIAALYSPATGIIDSHAFMQSLLGDAENEGAQIVFNTSVAGLRRSSEVWQLWITGERKPVANVGCIVNSGGLDALSIASQIEGYLNPTGLMAYFAKGTYFGYSGRIPFSHLVYPVPEPGGLGIHLTFDLEGQARFGPNVKWIDSPDYSVDMSDHSLFVSSIRNFWPSLDETRLFADYAGVRPKIVGPGQPAADFVVEGPKEHGVAGLINLFGIESPGLTSSLALAEYVIETLKGY